MDVVSHIYPTNPNPITYMSPIPIIQRALFAALFAFTISAHGQSIDVSFIDDPDTTLMSSTDILSLERKVTLSLPAVSSGSDTLIIELGSEEGVYDLFERSFPLNQTGAFADGCSLVFASGATVGLGSFTGLSTFYVRAYLTSSGVGSAVMIDSE